MAYEHVNGFIEKCNKDFKDTTFYANPSGEGDNQNYTITGYKPYFVCNGITYDITDIFNTSGIASDKPDPVKIKKLLEDTNKRVEEAKLYGGQQYFIDSLKFLGNDKEIQFSEGAVLDGSNNQDCVTIGYEPYFICNGITYKILDIVKKIKLSDKEKVTESIINENTKITVENIEKIKKDIIQKVNEAKLYASSRHFISSLNFVGKEYKTDVISFDKGVIFAEENRDPININNFYRNQTSSYLNREEEAYEPFFMCNGLKYYMFNIVKESKILNDEEKELKNIIDEGTKITVEKIDKIKDTKITVEKIEKIKEYIKGKVTEYKEKYTCPQNFCKKIKDIKIYDENRQGESEPIFQVFFKGTDIKQLLIDNKVATNDGFVQKIKISEIKEIIEEITNKIQKQTENNNSLAALLDMNKQSSRTALEYEPKPHINDKNNNKLLLDAIDLKFKESFNFHFFDNNLFIQPKNEIGKENVIKIDIENIKAGNIYYQIKKAIRKINDSPNKVGIHGKNAAELEKLLGKTSLAEIDKKVYNQTIVDKWRKLVTRGIEAEKNTHNVVRY